MEVFSTIETQLRLCNVFHSVVDHRWGATATHTLVGVVTYYGKHYQTYFYHTKLQVWLNFDDATVREIGPKWEQVVEKCRRGRYQPLLLLYAMQDGKTFYITSFHSDHAFYQFFMYCRLYLLHLLVYLKLIIYYN